MDLFAAQLCAKIRLSRQDQARRSQVGADLWRYRLAETVQETLLSYFFESIPITQWSNGSVKRHFRDLSLWAYARLAPVRHVSQRAPDLQGLPEGHHPG